MPVIGGVTDDANLEVKQIRVDPTTLRLKVDSNSSDGASAVDTAVGTVVNTGTRVQLASHACKRAFVQAYETNTGTIVVGGANCVAAAATRQGVALFATQGDWFNVSNTNLLYIDSTASGDKASYFYET